VPLVRLLRQHLAPHRGAVWAIVALHVGQTTAGLFLPALNASLIDEGILPGDQDTIWRYGAIMLAVSLVQVVLLAGAVRGAAHVGMAFGRDVRQNTFDQVLTFSSAEVGQLGVPSLITRITNDAQQVQTLLTMVLTMMITAPITMTVGVALAIREDVGLSVILAVVIPIEFAVLGAIIAAMTPSFRRMQELIDRVNSVLREQITGLRVVRAFAREPEEEARFATANDALTAQSMRASRLLAATFPTAQLMVNVAAVSLLWIGADRIDAGTTQLGSVVAYLSYLIQILFAVVMSTFMISMIPRAGVAAQRILEVLDTSSSVTPPAVPVVDLREPGTVEFHDAGFRYPGAERPVLDGVTFRVRPGETTAIIGSTGSGKSTLLALAARLADTTTGTVSVGGVDVRELDPQRLWSVIGHVPQQAFLFSGTIASNLRFGRRDATDQELWEAMETAQVADFVRTMPDGLDTTIDQGGTNVSGGQRQRLCIARALVARPDVYLFDDSFSALDLATEARLRAALEPHVTNSAVLVVAQRVATIENADQILVLEAGEVVGQGTHATLLHSCPTYAEIVASQRAEEDVA